MELNKKSFIYHIATVSPYLAPIPSAYFVARSATLHLEIPIAIGLIIGLIIETLGITSVHTWLLFKNWNAISRKSDPKAPAIFAFALVIVYILLTISLTIVLEVNPTFSIYAPALFPFLALIGAINIVLIVQQEQRELTVKNVHVERSEKRKNRSNVQNPKEHIEQTSKQDKRDKLNNPTAPRRNKKESALTTIINLLSEYPNMGVTELAKETGIKSRTTIYNYLAELQENGRI